MYFLYVNCKQGTVPNSESTEGKENKPPCSPAPAHSALISPNAHTYQVKRSSSFSTFNIYLLPTYLFLSSSRIYLFINRHHWYPQKAVAIIKAKLPWNRICQKYLAHTFFPLTFGHLLSWKKRTKEGGDSSLILDLEDPPSLPSTTPYPVELVRKQGMTLTALTSTLFLEILLPTEPLPPWLIRLQSALIAFEPPQLPTGSSSAS